MIRPPVEPRVYRQLFDHETLAHYLRLSTDTIDRLVKANKLACVRIGSQVRFRLEDVDAFLERNRTDDSPRSSMNDPRHDPGHDGAARSRARKPAGIARACGNRSRT